MYMFIPILFKDNNVSYVQVNSAGFAVNKSRKQL